MFKYLLLLSVFFSLSIYAQTKIGGSDEDDKVTEMERVLKRIAKTVKANLSNCKVEINQPIDSFKSLLKYLIELDMNEKIKQFNRMSHPVISRESCLNRNDVIYDSKLSCLLKGVELNDSKYIQNLKYDEGLSREVALSQDEINYLKHILINLKDE
jgi:hypothetical protein